MPLQHYGILYSINSIFNLLNLFIFMIYCEYLVAAENNTYWNYAREKPAIQKHNYSDRRRQGYTNTFKTLNSQGTSSQAILPREDTVAVFSLTCCNKQYCFSTQKERKCNQKKTTALKSSLLFQLISKPTIYRYRISGNFVSFSFGACY